MCNYTFKSKVVGEIHKEDHFDKVCRVAYNYLSSLGFNNDKVMDEGCKYLYYGIYNNILKNEECNYDKLRFYKMLLNEYFENSGTWLSYESYTDNMHKHIDEKNNDLMEMYDNFYNFMNSLNNQKGIPCKYAEKCINIYKECMKKCQTNDEWFCLQLEDFKKRHYQYMEDYFPCNTLQNFFPYIGRSKQKVIILTPIIPITLILSILYILYKVSTNNIY
ncbi:hypothetical protein PCYB_006420, partial [Plasmodium cynomolgi strain B]